MTKKVIILGQGINAKTLTEQCALHSVSGSFDFSKIQNGTIVRLKSDTNRDWVCIHHSNCNMNNRLKHNKNNKNHTGYYLFGGLWYEHEGSKFTDKAYGKCIERLERGMFNNIEIVGFIGNDSDYKKYIECERL